MYYEANPNPTTLFQGDILEDCPVVVLPSDLKILRPTETTSSGEENCHYEVVNVGQISDAFASDGTETIVTKAYRTNIMIISQTCDITYRDFISIVPVFPITRIDNENRKNSLRQGKVNYRFYLPESDGFEESYAEFTIINSVKKETLRIENRIISLTHYYRSHLVERLHSFFCRPFSI